MTVTRLAVNGRFLLQDVTGVQRVAIEFITALDALMAAGDLPGLEVDLWVPRDGTMVTTPTFSRVRLRRAGRGSGHVWEQLSLPRLVGRDPLLCLGNTAPVAQLLRPRATVSVMVHDLSYAYFPEAYSRAYRGLYHVLTPLVLDRADHVVTVAEAERAAILRTYPRIGRRATVTAVQNGTAPPRTAAPGLETREPMVLYVGSLTRRKNADGLLRIARSLTDSGTAKVVVVGSTGGLFMDAGLRDAVAGAHGIEFLGQVNDPDELAALYRRASVFVFPTFYEASPLPPLEAMSLGCPVVCSDLDSLRERCGDAAVYADPHHVETFTTAVRGLLSDAELWRATHDRGLTRAAGFSWERQVREVLEVIAS